MNDTEIKTAFADYDRQVSLHNSKVGAILAIVLMPFGFWLDWFVYPGKFWAFFELRLLSSVLCGFVLLLLVTKWGRRHYRFLGMAWYMIPALIIATMIYAAKDPISPYYAGFNLVLMTVGLILPWTYREICLAFALILALYLGACYFPGTNSIASYLFNNLFFLICTGVIVFTGSYFHSRLRHREFALRYELDQSRRTVEETNRKLVELDQVKSRFFANISHELRTPLTLLLAPLETMVHGHTHAFSDQIRNLLGTMHANGMRLLKLINDLLELVRLESGRMEIKREPVDLPAFVKGLISATGQVADDKRIRLLSVIAPEIESALADRDKLEKVILNLLFNALKFTPSGGEVTLSAQLEEKDLVFKVRDTGVGIAPQNLAYVFDRFWQADGSSKRKYQGVGIGLSLVKELTEIQGGSVAVESTEGKGTTFTIRLPYLKSDPPGPAPAPAATSEEAADTPAQIPITSTSEEWLSSLYRRAELFPAMTPLNDTLRPVESGMNGGGPTLLIADDEPDMLRFLKSQLVAHYQVLEAVDGQQAVDKAAQFLPDIILLDMMMPEKDGLQACKELREKPSTQSIPIILLTARADEETKLAALSAGASDFLPKPFSTTELHVRIKNLVESHHYQRKLSKQNQVLAATIEQLKETETQLVQTEKLASLGRMSAGIIHEINNPLNFATTGLFTLRKKGKGMPQEEQEEYAEILKDVEDGIVRVKDIVSDLRTFTHPDNEQFDHVEVPEAVKSALRFLSNEWRDKIQVDVNIPEDQTVWINRNKFIQVLTNLLQNSLDAVKAKSYPDGEKPVIAIEGRVTETQSIVTVHDNGTGIDSQHMDKIFDPFFTTKDVGQGMGLGLSICYRIVQQCDGVISVKSEPGKYCEFALEFPKKGQCDP